MMIEVNAGTAVEVMVEFEDATGVPVVPTDFDVWARPSGYYGTETVAIPATVVDGILVGVFLPPEPGTWTVAARMRAPVVVTVQDTVEVLPVIAEP